ncbi:ABC transporter substrate-binding protein [Nocardia sp. NPDC052254]|uniref:ABC transporter substrate-binding protein n=1 Tax=Nocardia sp. NPDC052254 TaxID=3155681 RepID=UPI00341F19D0
MLSFGRPRITHILAAVSALPVLVALASGCSNSGPGTTADGKTILRYQGQTGTVSPVELAADLGYFAAIELKWVGDTTSGPANIQAATTKQIEFGSAFNGAVVKLVAGGAPVTSVLSSYGADDLSFTGYYVRDDSGITTARDLIGKKVGVNTLGAHHEFVTRQWLHDQGLTDGEIEQVQLVVLPPVNTEQALREKQIDIAALSGPLQDIALAHGGIHPLYTDKGLFGQFDYGTYVFRKDYIQGHKDAVADFVQGTARATRWLQTTPHDRVVARLADIIGKRGRNENTTLLNSYKSAGIPVPGAVIEDREVQIWIDWLVRNGELPAGKLAAEDIYTNEFNPYANGQYPPGSGPTGEAVAAK